MMLLDLKVILEEEIKYKTLVRRLPIKIPQWRDKQQAYAVLHLDENSWMSSSEMVKIDVVRILTRVKIATDHEKVKVK